MRYRNRHEISKFAPILTLVGIYLLTRGSTMAGLILLAIGLSKLVRTMSNPQRRLQHTIRRDAARHGIRIPSDEMVWTSLESVYLKCRKSSAAFTQLETNYSELIDSMWAELRGTTLVSEWRRIIRMVAQEWPTPWSEGASPLEESMRRAKQATTRWREARREATGEFTV